jgi:hypothetical protein
MTAPPTNAPRARCTPADLRLQWSGAYSARRRDPEALVRLRRRVQATLDALGREISAAAGPAMSAALLAEIAEVRDVETALARMDARDAEAARTRPRDRTPSAAGRADGASTSRDE